MDTDTNTSCAMIPNRSVENRRAMACFTRPHEAMSPAFSIHGRFALTDDSVLLML